MNSAIENFVNDPEIQRAAQTAEGADAFVCETCTLAGIKDRVLTPPKQVLSDFADRGDKLFLIGTSKSRKSFAALQTALHIVSQGRAGMPFGVGGAE